METNVRTGCAVKRARKGAVASRDVCRVVCFNREKIASLRGRMPDREETERASAAHKALGHPGRLAVFLLLALEECCVCDVANVLGLPLSTASQHLRALRTAGLIRPRQDGKLVFYSVTRPEAVRFAAALTRTVR